MKGIIIDEDIFGFKDNLIGNAILVQNFVHVLPKKEVVYLKGGFHEVSIIKEYIDTKTNTPRNTPLERQWLKE